MDSSTKLVLLSTLLTLSVGLTAASPAELTIFPGESSTRIDSFTSYEVTVENTGPVRDVYTLSSSSSSEISIAPKQVELDPGQSEVVNVWYNPETQKEAGQYSFNVNAKSRANGNTYSAQGIVNVIREHDVSLEVEDSKTACLGERATYTVEVTNDGIQKEEFELTSPLGEFSRNKLTLEDGETAIVKLHVSSDEETDRTFNVVAASTTSYAQSIKSVDFQAETCYASDIVINPGSQEVPAGTTAKYDVTVRNTGTKADEFVLETNRGQLEQSTLQISAKSSKTTTINYTPNQLGQQTVEITANSEITSTGTATTTVYNGMESEITVPKQTVNTCENTEASTQLTVENTGEARETFTLQTNRGNLSTEEVTLKVGESTTQNLTFNTGDRESTTVNYRVTSTASTFGQPSNTVEGTFNIENCWDLEMTVIPEVASAGENMSQVYEVRLENTGIKENTYELSYEGPSWIDIRDRESDDDERTVTVPAGETGFADIYAGIPFQKEGEVEITATAVGEQVKESRTVKLVIGEDIEEAMESDRGGDGSITGSFTEAATGLINQVQGQDTIAKALLAVVIGLVLTVTILYWE